MPKETFILKRFNAARRVIIRRANEVLDSYAEQGLILTLRQLYYQFVARDWLPNQVRSYKLLGDVMGDARLAGMVDWSMLEDRTRNLSALQHFDGPEDALKKLHSWYHVDMWEKQKYRPEVWIEKDALVGVIERVCEENDVPYFSCRGYTSLSEMWRAAKRLDAWLGQEQTPYIIHFGDHDPSGIDMSRDIVGRLQKTFLSDCRFERVALNMDQIRTFNPPPNPAKPSDSRYQAYVAEFGTQECWELDALEPNEFRTIIEGQLDGIRDADQWETDLQDKEVVKNKLLVLGQDWDQLDNLRERININEHRIELLTAERDRWKAKCNKNGKGKK